MDTRSQNHRSSFPHPRCGHSVPTQRLAIAGLVGMLAVAAPAQLQFDELSGHTLPAGVGAARAVALGDIDGDGDLDLMLGNRDSVQDRLYANQGGGSFVDVTAASLPADSGDTMAVAFGDVDGDGDLDIVIGRLGQNGLYVNDGTGTFTNATTTRLPADSDRTVAIALGDVDGDSDLDIICGNNAWHYGQQDRLYINDGAGNFIDATASHLPSSSDNTMDVALGDVDGDGDIDLFVGTTGWGPLFGGFWFGAQNRLLLNDGIGGFVDATANLPFATWDTSSVALGDIDGDGDLDAVCGTRGLLNWSYLTPPGPANQNELYLNDGFGTFTDATAPRMPVAYDFTEAVALCDIDGDGDLDAVFGNSWLTPQNALYLNDGAGTFTDATATRLPIRADLTWAMAAGDIDGDGDPDLVTLDGTGPNRLDFNLQRQLHAPTAPQIGQPYTLDAYLRYGPPSTVDLALTYLSTGSASIPLQPFGTLGIDPLQMAPFPLLTIPLPAGVGTVGFTVPNMPSLIGQEIYSQAMLIAYPNDLRLTNVIADVIR